MRVRSMSIAPGATQLTRMPSGPSSTAATFVSISMPPLLAVYATSRGNATLLQPDPMLTIAPRPAPHVAGRSLRAEEAALQVGLDDEVPLVFGHVEKRRPGLDARVVDEHVQGSGATDHLVHHRGHLAGTPDVRLHSERLSPERFDLRDRLVGAVGRVVIVDGDIEPGLRQRQSDATPDAAPRASYECRTRSRALFARHPAIISLAAPAVPADDHSS